jgi:hypothetical protein
MARTDAETAFLEAQYAHSFWRPYSAIRLADTDGNDATAADPSWTPFWDTPNHPEYPSGTCTFTTASIEVLLNFYGDDFGFTSSYEGTKPWTRTFARLSAVVDDAIIGRICAGGHFRNSCLAGVELGRKIARNALTNFLRPVPHFTGAARLPAGEFQLQLEPGRNFTYVIQTSNDLAQWLPWKTNSYGIVIQTDVNAAAADRRFYRALILDP